MDVSKLVIPALLLFLVFRRGASQIAQRISIASGIKFSVTGAGINGVNFQLIVPVSNQSGVGVPVGRFDGKLYYGSIPVSNVTLPEPTYLTAGDTTSMILTGRINFQEVWGGIEDIFRAGDLAQDLTLKGSLKYGENLGLSLPVNYKVYQF